MFRVILWAIIFFLGATTIAIQPACHNWGNKPIHKMTLRMRGLQ